MAIIYRRNKSMRRNSALVPSMADRLPQQGKLTRRERASLPKKAFVFPSRAPGPGSYPIPNIHYAKLALNMASWSPKGKEELPEILPIVLKKYPELKNWDLIDRYYDIADEEDSYQMAANPRYRHNFHHNPGYRRNMATKHQDLKALRAKYRNEFGNEWYTIPRAYAAFQEEKKGLASTIARDKAIAKRSAGKSKASKAKKGPIALPGPTGYDCYPRKSNPKKKRKVASKRRSTAKRKTRKPTAAECRKCHSGNHNYNSFRSAHKGMYTQKQLLRHWKQYKRKHGIK